MLYNKIKELARDRKVSIYRIERDTDMSNGTISKWNESHPEARNLKKVSDYLEVSMEELLDSEKGGD